MNSNEILPDRYDPVAIHLHWIVAILMAFVGGVGLTFKYFPRSAQAFWLNMHAVVGLLFFTLVVVRLVWRLKRRPPELPASAGEIARRFSAPFHALIYALMIAIPPIGIVAFVWHERAFNFGLFVVDFGVRYNRPVFHPAQDYHRWLVYALFATVAVHAAAALWHQFVRRDGLIERMWPMGASGAARESRLPAE